MPLRTRSAAEYVEKLTTRTRAAIPDWQKGIERVEEAPGAAAARQAPAMLANLTEAVNSGRWAAKVGAVTKEEWQQKTLAKGPARIGPGLDAARPSMLVKAERLLSAVEAARNLARQQPRGTLEQNIQRSVIYMTEMAKHKGKI